MVRRCNHHYPGWPRGAQAAKVDLGWSNRCHLRQLVLIVVAPIWCLMHPSAAASYLFTYAYKRQKVTTYIFLELHLLHISQEFYPIFLGITVEVLLPLYGFAASHRCSDKMPATQNIIRSFMFCTVLVKCLLIEHKYSVKKSGAVNSGETPLVLVHVGYWFSIDP